MLQQARIIINIAVGKAGESLLIPYEEVGGEVKQVGLGDHIDLVLHDCNKRYQQPHMHLLPFFQTFYILTEFDRRHARNMRR